MSSSPSSPVVPGPQEAAGVTERDAVVWVGWRVERASASLRTVPYLVRGHLGWLEPDVRYAVLLTPTWRTQSTP